MPKDDIQAEKSFMTLANFVFVVYAVVVLGGAVMAVNAKSLVRALVGLMMTLFGVAGMYLLMAAPFVAFMQLLIYVGAVCVLIFLAIMLVRIDSEGEEAGPRSFRQWLNAFLGFVAPAVVLGGTLAQNPVASISTPEEVSAAELGQGLLGPYTLAFELISIVLLVAMAGAVLIAFQGKGGKVR